MDELSDKLINFIKGLMQPAITIVSIIIILFILIYGKTGAPYDQLFGLALGVVAFWFGKTIGLFADTKTQSIVTGNEKADLIQTVATQSQDLANSTPAPVVNTILEKLTPAVTTTVNTGSTVAATVPTDPDPDEYLKGIS
jgi:hypothetical protein